MNWEKSDRLWLVEIKYVTEQVLAGDEVDVPAISANSNSRLIELLQSGQTRTYELEMV